MDNFIPKCRPMPIGPPVSIYALPNDDAIGHFTRKEAKRQRNITRVNLIATQIFESFEPRDLSDWLDDWNFDADMDDDFRFLAHEHQCTVKDARVAFGRIAEYKSGQDTTWSPCM